MFSWEVHSLNGQYLNLLGWLREQERWGSDFHTESLCLRHFSPLLGYIASIVQLPNLHRKREWVRDALSSFSSLAVDLDNPSFWWTALCFPVSSTLSDYQGTLILNNFDPSFCSLKAFILPAMLEYLSPDWPLGKSFTVNNWYNGFSAHKLSLSLSYLFLDLLFKMTCQLISTDNSWFVAHS